MKMGNEPADSGDQESPQEDNGLQDIIEMGGNPKNPFSSMVVGINTALSKMEELLPQEGVSSDLIQQLSAIREGYVQVLQKIQQAMGSGGAQPAPGADAMGGPAGIPKQ